MLNQRNFLELSGNLIYLKKADVEYLDDYWDGLNNSSIEAMIYTGTQQIFNKAIVAKYLEEIAFDNSRVDFIIFSKDSNRLLGEVCITDIFRNNRNASLRISLNKKEDFSKGYGSEALILALNYSFSMLNLHRIELEVFPFNKRAAHTYEKIGFIKEGIKRDGCFYNHKYYDMILMSILEEEFRKKYIEAPEFLDEFDI